MPRRTAPYVISTRFKPEAEDLIAHAYPFDIPAVRAIGDIAYHPNVTYFVGENGSGKSTVLEALATVLGFAPEGGTRNTRLSSRTEVSGLHEVMRVARGVPAPSDGYFLRAESFFSIASYVDEIGVAPSYGGRSLHEQSHGEAFLSTLLHKLRGNGIYLLDEPEAALSPSRQLVALRAFDDLVQAGSQLIVATHSPILLAYPYARIYRFDAEGVTECPFEETEHFQVTRDFLNNYPRRVQQILE